MTKTENPAEFDSVRPLTANEFEQFRQLAYRTFGLDLKAGKEELVSARLRKLVRSSGFHRYQDYYASVLEDRTGEGLRAMIDALATNHTMFMREPDHFQFLKDYVVPAMGARDQIEVWSAACSTGEEVWTLGMVLQEAAPQRRIRISASDISGKALNSAQRAVYSAEQCEGLPAGSLSKFFVADGRPATSYRVGAALRAQVTFRRLNLLDSYSWEQPFPVIFCRNVMIYFDQATQERVIEGLTRNLEPGGYLFVGHAESLTRVSHNLEFVRPAVYRKRGRAARWSR